MTRRNPPAKWTLPNTVDPPTSTCYIVPVPDDPFHHAAFLGALAALGAAYKWADDPTHKAKDVAEVWREIADNLKKCPPPPKPIYIIEECEEMALCDQIRWHDGKLQVLCCGEWQDVPGTEGAGGPVGEQPPPQSRPDPGDSLCFNVGLAANNQWLFPTGISSGDILTITGAEGGWTDGTGRWYCPTGDRYILGNCIATCEHQSGDPDSVACHMEIIGMIEGGPTFSLSQSPYTVPAGISGAQLTFQANDGTPSDNGGTVRFQVCLENGAAPAPVNFCHVYDFATGDQQGWDVFSGLGSWNGHGFDTVQFGGYTAAIIGRGTTLDGIGVTKVTVVGYIDISSTDGNTTAVFDVNGGTHNSTGGIAGTAGGNVNDYFAGAVDSVQHVIIRGNGSGAGHIDKVIVEGTAPTNPFGTNNC